MPRFATLALSSTLAIFCAAGLAVAQDTKDTAKQPEKAEAPAAKKLSVGDAAPKLQVSKWVKGKEIKAFDTGKVYVVEFWATWCGPCKTTIPHLTDHAKKFKDKAEFIGVSVWEQGDDIPGLVSKFVEKMGDKMDYNVCLDDGQKMAETWMKAAKQNGIPTAFVVDKEGKIAWIGHPMAGLEGVVEKVIAGTFDSKAEAERAAKEAKEAEGAQAGMQAAFKKVQTAAKAEKWQDAVKAVDDMIAAYPKVAENLIPMKFDYMTKYDEKGAYAFVLKAAENEYKSNAMALNQIAWKLVEDDKTSKEGYTTALDLSKRSNDLTKNEDGTMLDTLAYCYFRTGNVAKAVELQEKAVKLVEKMGDAPDEMKDEMKERLQKFKKAAN